MRAPTTTTVAFAALVASISFGGAGRSDPYFRLGLGGTTAPSSIPPFATTQPSVATASVPLATLPAPPGPQDPYADPASGLTLSGVRSAYQATIGQDLSATISVSGLVASGGTPPYTYQATEYGYLGDPSALTSTTGSFSIPITGLSAAFDDFLGFSVTDAAGNFAENDSVVEFIGPVSTSPFAASPSNPGIDVAADGRSQACANPYDLAVGGTPPYYVLSATSSTSAVKVDPKKDYAVCVTSTIPGTSSVSVAMADETGSKATATVQVRSSSEAAATWPPSADVPTDPGGQNNPGYGDTIAVSSLASPMTVPVGPDGTASFSLSVTATGGSPPYQYGQEYGTSLYPFIGSDGTAHYSGLAPGVYTTGIYVSDQAGGQAYTNVVEVVVEAAAGAPLQALASPPPFSIKAGGAPGCVGDDVLTSGGRAPFSYAVTAPNGTVTSSRNRNGSGFCVSGTVAGQGRLAVVVTDAANASVAVSVPLTVSP